MGREEVYTVFRWGNLREGDYLEDPGIDRWIILKWIFRTWNLGAWTGSICLMTGTSGWHL